MRGIVRASAQVWDLGGQEKLRKAWGTYYINTQAVILVVDSTDRESIQTVKEELATITAHEDLSSAILLILANKQDAEGAMSAAEVSTALALHANKQHDWQIQVRRAASRPVLRVQIVSSSRVAHVMAGDLMDALPRAHAHTRRLAAR